MIQFKSCAVIDHAKSVEGKPVYCDGVEATITVDRKTTLVYQFPMRRDDEDETEYLKKVPNEVRNNWKENLLAYVKGTVYCDGTPLTAMTWLSSGSIETLRSAGISSVENLSTVTEGVLEPFGLDGATLRQQAASWLMDKSGKAVARMQKQDEEIKLLQEEKKEMFVTMQKMQAEIAELKAGQVKQEKPTKGK